MAQELEKRGHKVGSESYLAELNGSGLLQSIMRPSRSVDAYRILDGSGGYNLTEGRLSALEAVVSDSLFEPEHYGPDGGQFIEDLMGGNGYEQLLDLWRMWQYRQTPGNYEGHWREAIGSERYLERLEEQVFTSRLRGGDLSQGDYSYGDSLRRDLGELAATLYGDIMGTVNDEHISYENRERILEAAGQLEKWTPYAKSFFESHLEKWRRLEDFHNEVIEFETNGTVRAKMAWENGKNVMYIEADVCFMKGLMNGTADAVYALMPTAIR